MISWIQITFQKHTKLIFVFLLFVVAVPFVITIGSTPGVGRAGHKLLEKPFFNYNLESAEDYRRIRGDAELSIVLQAGFMPLRDDQIMEYALHRTAALELAASYGMPAPTKQELQDRLAKMRYFQGQDGNFDSKRYADFVDSLKSNPQVTRADLARVLSDDVRVEKMEQIIAGPGYVLPAEIKVQVERATTEWTISVASTEFDAFNPDIAVNELGLSTYFDNNVAKYTVPPRVSVDYVVFKPGAYTADVKFTEADLLAFYKENPSRFPTAADDKSAPTDSIPLAMRSAVEAAYRTQLASKVAVTKASDFAFTIFDQKVRSHSPEMDALIAAYGVSREEAPLFTAAQPPKALGWTTTISQEAFKLGDQRFFSDPLPLADGSAVVLLWNQTIPETKPELAAVRDAVVKDYKEAERRRLFVEAGSKWRAQLESKLASGMTLEAAAASMTTPKFEVTTYPAFPRRQPPEKIDQAALSALETTPAGQLSLFTVSGQKGILVDVISKKAPDVSTASPEYAAAFEQMSRTSAAIAQNSVLSGIVERELAKSPSPER